LYKKSERIKMTSVKEFNDKPSYNCFKRVGYTTTAQNVDNV